MSEKTTIICSRCEKEIEVEPGMTAGFCLFCGAPFQISAASGETLQSHAETLYNEGHWASLLAYIQHEDTDAYRLYRAAAALHKTVDDYADAAQTLYDNTRKKSVLTMIIGRNAYADDPMHSLFHVSVAEDIDRFVALVVATPSEAALGRKLSGDLVRFFTQEKYPENNPVYWSFVACEFLISPLLPLMDTDALAEVYAEYTRKNPPNQTLPNQKKLKDQMAALLAKAGIDVPKEPRFRFRRG